MKKIILEARNLTKKFDSGLNELTVLNGLNITVHSGESVAIVGPSGSGKSTLLGLLAGLDTPTGGEVLFENKALNKLSEQELSQIWGRQIGFIFQSYHLLPTLTAEENVRVPLELSGDKDAGAIAQSWLKKVGLENRTHHLPSKLSGGEQQRVALARALAPNPLLLFADEPTGNLDSKTGQMMGDLLFSLVKEQGTTLVLVTHEKGMSERAERLIRLN